MLLTNVFWHTDLPYLSVVTGARQKNWLVEIMDESCRIREGAEVGVGDWGIRLITWIVLRNSLGWNRGLWTTVPLNLSPVICVAKPKIWKRGSRASVLK